MGRARNTDDHPFATAVTQLALLPLILAWAVLKGLLIGIIAVITFGALT